MHGHLNVKLEIRVNFTSNQDFPLLK